MPFHHCFQLSSTFPVKSIHKPEDKIYSLSPACSRVVHCHYNWGIQNSNAAASTTMRTFVFVRRRRVLEVVKSLERTDNVRNLSVNRDSN